MDGMEFDADLRQYLHAIGELLRGTFFEKPDVLCALGPGDAFYLGGINVLPFELLHEIEIVPILVGVKLMAGNLGDDPIVLRTKDCFMWASICRVRSDSFMWVISFTCIKDSKLRFIGEGSCPVTYCDGFEGIEVLEVFGRNGRLTELFYCIATRC